MLELIQNWLLGYGLNESLSFYGARGISITGTLFLSAIAAFIAKRYIVAGLTFVLSKLSNKWKDALLRQKVLRRLVYLVPAVVIYDLIPITLEGHDSLISFIQSALSIYMIIIVMLVLNALLSTVEEIYQSYKGSKRVPIKGFIQAFKIVLFFITAIFVISIFLDKTPVYLLSGVGALAAVMMLVFRDSILGFVAGIQLAANKMVAVGDWIEMPKYGADGDVHRITMQKTNASNLETWRCQNSARLIRDSLMFPSYQTLLNRRCLLLYLS